jgi:phosphinothricin acetyltransferase
MIEPMLPAHWPEVRRIYRQGIDGGNATFETQAPGWEEWNAAHLPHSRLVAVKDGAVLGWAALSSVSRRVVYAGVAEVSIYVDETARGAGVGKALLSALIAESERNGIWTLQAGIFPENMPSLALHRALGFREAGRRERIGLHPLQNRWRDTILLERRSASVGV